MCLNRLYPREKIKKLPRDFVAYKVVIKGKDGKYYFPVFNTTKQIEQDNIASKLACCIYTRGKGYKPYYHSFKTQRACDAVEKAFPWKYSFIKIKIKKRFVTRIGEYGAAKSHRYKTIVSRRFTTEFEEYIPKSKR